MHNLYRLFPLSASLALMLIVPVQAAEVVPLQKTSLSELHHMFQLNFSAANMPVMKPMAARKSQTNSMETLQLIEQHADARHMTHARMQQYYDGIPVFGGYAVLHSHAAVTAFASTKDAVHMNGTIYRGLEAELGVPTAAFIERKEIALRHFTTSYQENELSEAAVLPMVYLDDQHHAHWAYKVSVLIHHENTLPERPTAIIDADTFEPFVQWNDVKTAHTHVKGMGFGGNSRVGAYQFGKDFPLLELTRDASAHRCYMDNTYVSVVDMRHHQHQHVNTPVSFECDNHNALSALEQIYWTGVNQDGYSHINGAYSPEDDALYIGTVIHKMYASWYGVHALEMKNKPMKLVMRLHYGKEYENAFWDGKEMTFGDGGEFMYPLVSLTVGAHEISHGFTEQHAGLYYYEQSGAMNEAFSDMAAQAAEYYSKGSCNWQIGEEIMKETSGFDALRYLDEPTRDGYSIARADKYEKGMDVHYASGIYNRLFYVLANRPGWNPRTAFHVMVKANMDYWTPFSTFSEGACGILSAAKDLEFATDDVKVALDDVAIDYKDC